ncbi:NERD domain-containing protein [Aquiluna sp. KACHI24]|uniref:nuclease-related domain-containing DEAD/DEAH box helicase n=1 Tax=Aquiluna sp. KACHI24 TaxID=2968831 RepID=UPI0021F97C83|nr:NERD domain-containing protein [Aquiluna sp. KACHI24]BDQ00951.1 nuclease [Aquiluna sp. KACHI24]
MKFIPESPRGGANVSEVRLFEALKAHGAETDWTAVHSILIGRDPDVLVGEADFFVLIPNRGIVVIEAKAPTQVTYKSGDWFLEGTPNPKKNPLDQANRARGALRKFIAELGMDDEVPIARMVWFTSLGRHQFDPVSRGDFQFHEWELGWKQDLAAPVKAIENVLDNFLRHYSKSETIKISPGHFTQDVSERISSALFADFTVSEDPRDRAKERADERRRLLADQFKILNAIEDNPHIYLEGAAGSGKSFLISEAAMRSRRDEKRTLVTCWNVLMAEELARQIPHSNDLNFVVKDINCLMLEFAGLKSNPSDASSEWYEEELPELALAGLKRKPFLGNFSAILIDEFQDLVGKLKVLEFLLSLGKGLGLSQTNLVLAGDERQQILVDRRGSMGSFATAKALLPGIVKYKLKANTRMSPKLHREMQKLLGIKLEVDEHLIKSDQIGGLTVIETTQKQQATALKDCLNDLLLSYSSSEIRVLSPFGAQRSLIGKLFESEVRANDEVWLKSHARHASTNGEIRWRSISKFKGLEDEVVVITDIGQESADFFAERGQPIADWLYVGISRARHRCILITTTPIDELLRQ